MASDSDIASVSTTPDTGPGDPAGQGQAILIHVGSAADGGQPHGERLHFVHDGIELGRRPEPSEGITPLAIADRKISSRHLRISRTRTGYELVDLGSTNGTLVNGRAVTAPQPLRDGNCVFVGGQSYTFRITSQSSALAMAQELAHPLGPLASAAPAMAVALRRLRKLARSEEEILLVGETGVGKEVYARAVHAASSRPGPFVAVNCAAVPPDLVESELFGFVKGAHSQALRSKPGLIEQAESGTLFLDEVGDMPGQAQAKLLRFLQDHEFFPLGATAARRVHVRVVAATRHASATDGSPGLREDLLARLGAQPVELLPLRERPEDVGVLVHHFLSQAGYLGPIESSAFLALCLYPWPRNVRELEKTIKEAVLINEGDSHLRLSQLPAAIARCVERQPEHADDTTAPAGRRRSPRPAPERAQLETLLRVHRGNVAEVARALDRQWAVVWRWLGKMAIDPADFKE